jgi:hypothetical protein
MYIIALIKDMYFSANGGEAKCFEIIYYIIAAINGLMMFLEWFWP